MSPSSTERRAGHQTSMFDLSKINSWKEITVKLKAGLIVSLIVAAFLLWSGSDEYVITPAEAAEQHKTMIGWQLDDVRRQIENIEIKKVETKYRDGLSQQAKDELIAGYEIKLKRLRNSESCLSKGRLRCE